MNKKNLVVLLFLLFASILIWMRGGVGSVYLDTDLGRDLSEISNIAAHHIVWLGPRLSPGFQASPIYYYSFYPALLLSQGIEGHGDGNSLIVANVFYAAIFLAFFGWLSIKKWKGTGLIATAAWELTPWLRSIVMHPGNGFTYGLWLFLSLTALYFEVPLFWSAVFFGMATAFHPAALVTAPVFLFEWWRRKNNRLVNFFLCIIGFSFAWSPLLLFEIITKGYLIRSWLAHPGTGVELHWSLINLQQMANMSHLSLLSFLGIWIIVGIVASRRLKGWWLWGSGGLIFFSYLAQVPPHYVLGILCLMWFTSVVVAVQKKWGQIFLGIWIGWMLITTVILSPTPQSAARSITSVSQTVDQFIQHEQLPKNKKIAVLAAMDMKTEVPQADDYRFFLRMKGYTVLEVQQYSQANILIMFIEQPGFDWKHWSNWQTEQFGTRQQIDEMQIQNTHIVVFTN